MVRVQAHGAKTRIQNPSTGEMQDAINVRFIEEDRQGGGANPHLSKSTAVLSQAVGKQVGLPGVRVHTQPILLSQIGEFPVGREFPNLFINRTLYSTPQMEQQEGTAARMLDGQPTYFATFIDTSASEDEDKRLDPSVVAQIDVGLFTNARTRNTLVERDGPIMSGVTQGFTRQLQPQDDTARP